MLHDSHWFVVTPYRNIYKKQWLNDGIVLNEIFIFTDFFISGFDLLFWYLCHYRYDTAKKTPTQDGFTLI